MQHYLVATHFILGKQSPNYETEASGNFRPFTTRTERDPYLAATIRQTHFSMGNLKKQSYQSVYLNTMRPYNLAEAYVQQMPNRTFLSCFQIGMNDRPLHATESQLM